MSVGHTDVKFDSADKELDKRVKIEIQNCQNKP